MLDIIATPCYNGLIKTIGVKDMSNKDKVNIFEKLFRLTVSLIGFTIVCAFAVAFVGFGVIASYMIAVLIAMIPAEIITALIPSLDYTLVCRFFAIFLLAGIVWVNIPRNSKG